MCLKAWNMLHLCIISEMCWIDNMGAKMPLPELITKCSSRVSISGAGLPFTARYSIPATPGPHINSGDTLKRPRTAHDDSRGRHDHSVQYFHSEGVDFRSRNGSVVTEVTPRTGKEFEINLSHNAAMNKDLKKQPKANINCLGRL